MQSLKSYFLTCFLLSFCSIILAQENEYWTPADSIYQYGMKAHINNDGDLADNCFLYLHDATDYFLKIKDYYSAIEYAVCNQKLSSINYGENSHEHAYALIKCANIYDDLGRYREAIKYNLQARDIELFLYEKDTTTKISPLLITSLHNTASDMGELGASHLAIDNMKAALYFKYKANYPHESLVSSWSALAVMYSDIGDYETAFSIGLIVLDFRKSQKIMDEKLVQSYSDLASYSCGLGIIEGAIECVQKGIVIQTDSLGKMYSSLNATMHNNLSFYYNVIGEYDKALESAQKVIEINKYLNIEDGNIYGLLSYIYEQKHDTIQALKYMEQNVSSLEGTGTRVNYLKAKNSYAELLYRYGIIEAYIQSMKDLFPYYRNYIQSIISTVSPHSALRIWNNYQEILINHQCKVDAIVQDKSLKKIIYNNLLFHRRMAQTIEKYTLHSIAKDNDEIETYEFLKKEYKITHSHENKIILKLQIESLEPYSNEIQGLDITLDTLKDVINFDDVTIEILIGELLKTKVYYALILRKNWDAPKSVILGNEAELDSMSYPKLQQAVWQAIIDSAQIKEGENIYFAPDGIFYNMPIEYLPTADGRNMSDKYNMFRVSSTRELCYRDTAKTYSTAVLYGGLRYDATPQNLIAQNSSTRGWKEGIHESVLSQWRADDRAKYNYLPYTLMEVDSISQTIGNAIQVTTYTDKEGSEESFKSLSGHSPSILHIATHGYYITPTKAEMMSKENLYRYGLTAMDDRPSVIDYSMERTGLLMAGAQHTLRGDSILQAAEDGILSAKEISHLDLSNTDLVVLSACQTALGDITNDGVAGLQRGFKIAGVKSVLMSLWKVDDAATYLLMKQFYKSLFAGKNKQQALRDAQNYLRSYTVGNEHPYNDIHYWGAFVLLDAIEK